MEKLFNYVDKKINYSFDTNRNSVTFALSKNIFNLYSTYRHNFYTS